MTINSCLIVNKHSSILNPLLRYTNKERSLSYNNLFNRSQCHKSIKFLYNEFRMNTEWKHSNYSLPNHNHYILYDMNLLYCNRIFKISNKTKLLFFRNIDKLSNNSLTIMDKKYHNSFIISTSTDLDIQVYTHFRGF